MAASGVGASSKPAAQGIPDVTVLFGRAVKLIRNTKPPTYKRAIVFEADGFTAGNRAVKTAAGIVRWRFVFQNSL